MDTRSAKLIARIAAALLVAVWLAGPLGTITQELLRPPILHCHCPGHADEAPFSPGPAFAPCDHDAKANLAADRSLILPAPEVTVYSLLTVLPTPQFPSPDHQAPSPDTPPPLPHV